MVSKAPVTYVAMVLDRSSSMSSICHEAIQTFNHMRDTLIGRERTKMALITFSDTAQVQTVPTDVANVRTLTPYDYRPSGWTALYDGVDLAITTLQDAARTAKRGAQFLLIVVTDGEENSSRRVTQGALRKTISDLQDKGSWTFAFNVPPGYAARTAQLLDLPRDNVREWEATAKGMIETRVTTNSAMDSYYMSVSSANAAGNASQVRSFYAPVTTDLSSVKAASLKRELDDLSAQFKLFDVPKEQVVKEFVESKTRKPYLIGQAYYQLMKPEKVQPTKSVLIQEKGKSQVWGGPEARELIGLPSDQHAKVTPGNHSNYDIYVQSTSWNRKLPRGTKVLVDLAKVGSDLPTWGTGTPTT